MRLIPRYGTPWHGCDEHYPAMREALYLGQSSSDAEVRVEPATKPAPTPWKGTPVSEHPTLLDDDRKAVIPDHPTEVQRDVVRGFIEQMGFKPTDVCSLEVHPTFIEATLYCREPASGKIATLPGGRPATELVTVAVK